MHEGLRALDRRDQKKPSAEHPRWVFLCELFTKPERLISAEWAMLCNGNSFDRDVNKLNLAISPETVLRVEAHDVNPLRIGLIGLQKPIAISDE